MLLFDEGGDLNMLKIPLELDKTKTILGGLTYGYFAASDGVVQIGVMIGLGYIWKLWRMCSVVQSMSCWSK